MIERPSNAEQPPPPESSAFAVFAARRGVKSPAEDIVFALILLAVCAIISTLGWLKTASFWNDAPRWFLECWRTMQGDVPYRDFTFQYPPLGLYLFAAVFRVFGATFPVSQVLIDLLATATVLLTWRAGRTILPNVAAFAAALLTAIVFYDGTVWYSYFSLDIYTPAAHIATIGILLFLMGLGGWLRDSVFGIRERLLCGIGAFVCLLGKPEVGIAVLLLLAILTAADRGVSFAGRPRAEWLRFHTTLWALCLLPSIAVYAVIAAQAGLHNLIAGASGYGQASIACPLWPTGFGLMDAVSGIGNGLFVLFVLAFAGSLLLRRPLSQSLRSLAPAAILGEAFYWWFHARFSETHGLANIIRTYSLHPRETLLSSAKWLSVVFALYVLAIIVRGCLSGFRTGETKRESAGRPPLTRETLLAGLWIICCGGMQARGLFGTHLDAHPDIAPISVALLCILAVYLAVWAQKTLVPGLPVGLAARIVAVVAVAFFVARIGINVLKQHSGPRVTYTQLETMAGPVKVNSETASAAVYEYVAAHTQPGDYVEDIGYGGAINVALRRPSPSFATQYVELKLPEEMRDRDLRLLQAHPPALVLSFDPLGKKVAYGTPANTGCTCPRFVFEPDRPGWQDVPMPAIDYLLAHYHEVARFPDIGEATGSRVILAPNP